MQQLIDRLREAFETRNLLELGRIVDALRSRGLNYNKVRDFFIVNVGYIAAEDYEDLMYEIDLAEGAQ